MHIRHFRRAHQWLCSWQSVTIGQNNTHAHTEMELDTSLLPPFRSLKRGACLLFGLLSQVCTPNVWAVFVSQPSGLFQTFRGGCMCGSEADFCWTDEIWTEDDRTLLQEWADISVTSNSPRVKALSCVNTGTVAECKHTRTLPRPSIQHIPLSTLRLCCPATYLNQGSNFNSQPGLKLHTSQKHTDVLNLYFFTYCDQQVFTSVKQTQICSPAQINRALSAGNLFLNLLQVCRLTCKTPPCALSDRQQRRWEEGCNNSVTATAGMSTLDSFGQSCLGLEGPCSP